MRDHTASSCFGEPKGNWLVNLTCVATSFQLSYPHLGLLSLEFTRAFRVLILERMHESGYPEFRSPHIAAISWIDRDGIRLTALALRVGVGAPALSEVVNQLEEMGHIRRRPDPDDGRAKLIVATAKGERARTTLIAENVRLHGHLAEVVGKRRFDDVISTMETLIALADESVEEEARTDRRRPRVAATPARARGRAVR
jgi:DNA-binding MarR family transcriptional regulator